MYLGVCQKEKKLPSYKLDYIAKDFFNTKKADCPYQAIPGTFYRDILRLLFYNEKDVAITGRIFNYLNTAINSLEFVKLAGCFKQQECYSRGQQFKVLALVMRIINNTGVDVIIDAPKNTVTNIMEQYKQQMDTHKANLLKEDPFDNSAYYKNNQYKVDDSDSDSDSDDDDDSDDEEDYELNFKTMTAKKKTPAAASSNSDKKTTTKKPDDKTTIGKRV